MSAKNSQIISFYKDKTVFLTGGTGFVGKLVTEQLLRKCDLKKLYLLIRPKKGVEPKQRLEKLFEDVVFERLLREKTDSLDKVELVCGDISLDNLGLNEQTLANIIENVNIVIHGAATVKFDESIKVATNINVKGTITIIKLCHKIKNLTSFVQISTAFSNCPHNEIKEEFYKPPMSCEELIRTVDKLEEKDLSNLLYKILGEWPNTYSFTKAVAEDAVRKYAKGLPVSVVRPAIIVATMNEPVPGWIDNIYGPTGLLVGVALGILRVLRAGPNKTAAIVPADMAASSIIAAVYKTSLIGRTDEIPIYNYVPSKTNNINWEDFKNFALDIGDTMPLEKAVWVHSCTLKENAFIFLIYSFFLHFLPALLIDLVMLTVGGKTGAIKMYKKGTKFIDALAYFSTKTWIFSDNNVQALWSGMNEHDKQLFNFNMYNLNWNCYFKNAVPGIRVYLVKESTDNIGKALKKYKRRKIIHNFLTTFFYGFTLWLIWKCLLFIYEMKR